MLQLKGFSGGNGFPVKPIANPFIRVLHGLKCPHWQIQAGKLSGF
jgi:hypothetical protein